jgi:hypothetical protein
MTERYTIYATTKMLVFQLLHCDDLKRSKILCVYDMDFELNIQKELADVYIYVRFISGLTDDAKFSINRL